MTPTNSELNIVDYPPYAESAGTLLKQIFPGRVSRILLVTPPDVDEGPFNYFHCRSGRYANYPAYGAGILAAHLIEDGYEVEILNLNHILLKTCHESTDASSFDYNFVVENSLKTTLDRFNPDIVGVSCMFSLTHRSAVKVCQLLKCIRPMTPIALGGVHITNALSNPGTKAPMLRDFPEVDLFFHGESELAFKNLFQVIAGTAPVSDLSQVSIRNGQETLNFTGWSRPGASDIRKLPALNLLNLTELSSYGKIGGFHYLKPPGTRFSTVLSNRGCRAQCSFCSVRAFNGAGVRVRSVDSVVDELAELEEKFGVHHIVWLDDDFLFDKAHAMALFDGIVRRGLKMTWDCSNGVIAAACSEEIIAGMAQSGCLGLVLGVESGNPGVLRQMRKPGTVDSFRKAAEILRRYPAINTRVFLMFGFPGETLRMIKDTFDLAREMDPDWAIIQAVQPLPNTPLFDQMVAEGLIQPSEFEKVRYSLGYYGKLKDRTRNVMTNDFHAVFENHPLDEVPGPHQQDDIWAYLNYYLNFERLKKETRPQKLEQQLKWLEFVTDLVTPDGAIALYYRSWLEQRLNHKTPQALIDRLNAVLTDFPEWHEQFDRLGFSPGDLEDIHSATGTGSYAPFQSRRSYC